MTGMSVLRPLILSGLRTVPNGTKCSKLPLLQKQMQLLGQVSVRNGGGERKMVIQPSRFDWERFKNDLHFSLMLGLIPIGAIILYANLFIGPAELADIPEGYEPKEWEYYQSPIKRWFVKYVYETPQKQYEKTLHYLQQAADERYWNLLEKKVKTLANDRQDYKGWYWVDVHKGIREYGDELIKKDQDARGT